MIKAGSSPPRLPVSRVHLSIFSYRKSSVPALFFSFSSLLFYHFFGCLSSNYRKIIQANFDRRPWAGRENKNAETKRAEAERRKTAGRKTRSPAAHKATQRRGDRPKRAGEAAAPILFCLICFYCIKGSLRSPLFLWKNTNIWVLSNTCSFA